MHDKACHLGVELQPIGLAIIAESLIGEGLACRQELAALGEREAFAVPMIDLRRPVAELASGFGGLKREIADLDKAVRMRSDLAAQMPRQHLGAKTNAKEGLLLLERNRDPVGLGADEVIAVIGAHRPAEDRGPFMLAERFG